IILLEIDECGPSMTAFGKQIELVRERVTEEYLADAPAHALGADGLAAAQAIEDLERAFRVADGARADADRIVVVDDERGLAALREVDGGDEPDRARADDDHAAAARRTRELRRAAIRINGIAVGVH